VTPLLLLVPQLLAAPPIPRAVIAPSGLRLRDAPDSDAEIVDKLPYGTRVLVMSQGPATTEGDREGRWVSVLWDGGTGYLFDAWLSAMAPAPEGCEGLADWADDARFLCGSSSTGAVTAKAVTILKQLDDEIRDAGDRSLDDLLHELLTAGEPVDLDRVARIAAQLIGEPSDVLHIDNLPGCHNGATGSPRA